MSVTDADAGQARQTGDMDNGSSMKGGDMTYIVCHMGDDGSILMTPRGAYRAIRQAGHAAPTTARRIITDMVVGRVAIAWVGWVGYGMRGNRLAAEQID